MFDIFKRKEKEVNREEEFIFNPNNYKKVSIDQYKVNHIFELNDGTHLSIQEYQQYNINGGILLGKPTDLTSYFKNSFEKAKEFFNDEFLIIQPVLFTEKSYSNDDTYLLPQFLTTAFIDRDKPLPGEDFACSSLRVIWWQNTLGLPEPEILEQIKSINWQKPYAYSWDF